MPHSNILLYHTPGMLYQEENPKAQDTAKMDPER